MRTSCCIECLSSLYTAGFPRPLMINQHQFLGSTGAIRRNDARLFLSIASEQPESCGSAIAFNVNLFFSGRVVRISENLLIDFSSHHGSSQLDYPHSQEQALIWRRFVQIIVLEVQWVPKIQSRLFWAFEQQGTTHKNMNESNLPPKSLPCSCTAVSQNNIVCERTPLAAADWGQSGE